jgi:hypothetical protein
MLLANSVGSEIVSSGKGSVSLERRFISKRVSDKLRVLLTATCLKSLHVHVRIVSDVCKRLNYYRGTPRLRFGAVPH